MYCTLAVPTTGKLSVLKWEKPTVHWCMDMYSMYLGIHPVNLQLTQDALPSSLSSLFFLSPSSSCQLDTNSRETHGPLHIQLELLSREEREGERERGRERKKGEREREKERREERMNELVIACEKLNKTN